MILSLEPGVQATIRGGLELSSPGVFVHVNGHPGKAVSVSQGVIWSQPPFLAPVAAPPWDATS